MHIYGLSLVWDQLWLSRFCICEKAQRHWLYWNGFFTVCFKTFLMLILFIRCYLESVNLVSRLRKWQYMYVFSPVYVLKCLVKIVSCVKYFAHWLHLYGLFSVCVRKCISMTLFCLKSLSHWPHWYLSFSVCILKP